LLLLLFECFFQLSLNGIACCFVVVVCCFSQKEKNKNQP